MSTTKPFTVCVKQGDYKLHGLKLSDAEARLRHFPLKLHLFADAIRFNG